MKNRLFMKEIIIGVTILIILSGLTSVNAEQNNSEITKLSETLYVGGTGPGNYSNIWEAVINASDGDTVFVYDDSAPYIEHVSIYNQIFLIGENKETTVIDGNGTGNVVNIAADFVTVSGFTIQNGEKGIYLDEQSNTTISDNIIIDNNVHGIHYYSSCDYNTVTGNTVSNNGEIGIYFSSFAEHNIISENLISNNLNGSSLAGFAYGEITGNSFEDNTEYALTLRLWCNENKIHFNNFIGNGKDIMFFQSVLNRWSFNYWDRPRLLPKPIIGIILVFPWIKFDWRPLLTPHELQ